MAVPGIGEHRWALLPHVPGALLRRAHYRCERCGRGPVTERDIRRKVSPRCQPFQTPNSSPSSSERITVFED